MGKMWNMAIQHALRMFRQKEKYAYLYGANGEVGSEELVNRLWAMYPDHFEEFVTDAGYEKEDLIRHVRGKICLDCSSFICYVTQQPEFDKLAVTKDLNSTMLRSQFAVTRKPVEGTAGSVLWKPGHVALDIGYGMCLEFAYEFVDMQLNTLSTRGFIASGELKYMDYTDTNSR